MASTSVIQSSVLKILGMDSSDTVMLSRALEWINEALDDVQMQLPEAEFLQRSEMYLTTIDGQATYALPSNFIQMLSLRDDSNASIIDPLTREEFDREHPDPSTETEAPPSEYTLEYDRDNKRNILRFGPIPDDAYVLYGVMRCWHPVLSTSQNPQWDKLEHIIKRRGAYYGSLEIYPQQEFTYLRNELNALSLSKIQGLQNIIAIQKPHPHRIPVVLKKQDW